MENGHSPTLFIVELSKFTPGVACFPMDMGPGIYMRESEVAHWFEALQADLAKAEAERDAAWAEAERSRMALELYAWADEVCALAWDYTEYGLSDMPRQTEDGWAELQAMWERADDQKAEARAALAPAEPATGPSILGPTKTAKIVETAEMQLVFSDPTPGGVSCPEDEIRLRILAEQPHSGAGEE